MWPYIVAQTVYEDRLRDAAKHRRLLELLRDPSEQMPNEVSVGLLHQIKQWMRMGKHPQRNIDARRATAV